VVTAVNQSVLDSLDFYPYGQQSSGDTTTTHKFTGKERDSETAPPTSPLNGLDYFGARYYASTIGRFMTPDWSDEPDPVPHANIQNPQTLNLYGYVQNNPLSRRDADGHVTCDPDTTTWGPLGVTVTAGACHLDAWDYLTLGYYAFQGLNQFQQQQAAQNRQAIANGLEVIGPALLQAFITKGPSDCGCGTSDD
jgi:RHS repeat-associated protein